MKEFEACILCGIKKGFSLYPDCDTEAKKWGIDLVAYEKLGMANSEGNHVWTIMREAPSGYFKSISEII